MPRRMTRPLLMLTFVTGIVDATCFLALGQVFAAMQTGNVIFLGLGIAGAGGAPLLAPLIALGAFLVGAFLAATVLASGRASRPRGVPAAPAIEVGLLGAAALLAAAADPGAGTFGAYLLIVALAVAMGLRNTLVRAADPNVPTTVLNLTLTAATSLPPTGLAANADLAERATGLLAILLGAVAGALLLKASLALPLAAAAAITAFAVLSPRPLDD